MAVVYHDKYLRDRLVMFAFHRLMAFQTELPLGPEGRPGYDKMIARLAMAAKGVTYDAGTLHGVDGWWCRPPADVGQGAILYLHGGAYVLGSAEAYRHYVGQIAIRAGVPAFVADYSLAPERPFPNALDDALAAYRGLAGLGYVRIAIAGDSAGAGLALAVLRRVSKDTSLPRPAGAMVASPWTDLALTGASMETRAKVDPIGKRSMLIEAAAMYLGSGDRRDPSASPLDGDLSLLPPVLIHVGEDEILLDDSLRYAERLEEAGGLVTAHVWRGMPHVFCGLVGMLQAAPEALDIAGVFLRKVLATTI
jgi:monoterpene epsilon-lactone hydrolase